MGAERRACGYVRSECVRTSSWAGISLDPEYLPVSMPTTTTTSTNYIVYGRCPSMILGIANRHVIFSR